jgi:hypothetical protein
MTRCDNSASRAFTRTELLFTVVGIALIGCLVTACKSKAARQNDLARCKDNLKNITLALNLWIEDNEASWLPWHRNNPAVPLNDHRRNES